LCGQTGSSPGGWTCTRQAVLISLVDTDAKYYDSTVAWRERAMRGTLHSGDLVSDPRSDRRTRI
jgi:hypothetical protein